ncbi:MAG: hypothetical protein ACYDA5_11090 [Vulcanimicrobiaceae bacterium]
MPEQQAEAATLDEVRKHGHVLTPGRYVGTEELEDDGEAFAEKMTRLTATLADQIKKGEELDANVRENLAKRGYPLERSND